MDAIKILSRILAVLLIGLSAVFLGSSTTSVTGYSILQAGSFFTYFPFMGALSLITAFILLLNE